MSTESQTLAVPQPQARKVRIEEVDGDLELSCRQMPWGVAVFLVLWMTIWTVGCVALLNQALTKPCVENILPTIPFLAGWILMFAVLLSALFGVVRVRLGPDGLEYQAICLIPLYRQWVPRAELKGVSAELTTYLVKDRSLPCVKIETLGQPLQFAQGISEEEQRWLVEQLNEYLNISCPYGSPQWYDARCREGNTTDRPVVARPAPTPVEPPSDTRIEGRQHLDKIEFVWRGHWNPGAIALMTFITLFWNGLLSIFICKQFQDFDWFSFFFLIPHEIIGLCFFGFWLMTLTAPFWCLTWTFGEREATRRLNLADANAVVFDLGWNKRFDVQPHVRIELRRREREKQSGSLWPLLSHPDGEYAFALLGDENKELLRIDRLTEGDARWIADTLLRAFPSWRQAEKPDEATVKV